MQAPAPTNQSGLPTQIVVPGPNGAPVTVPVPMTRSEVRALVARRGELSTQLASAQHRRDALARQLQDPGAVDRAGLQAQVTFLDSRILGIETDIAENGKALASIPANFRQTTAAPPIIGSIDEGLVRDVTGLIAMAMLIPFALLWVRRLWRRDRERVVVGISPDRWEDGLARMERLESAVGAIAVEVERVAEGQRFITHVLAERAPAGLRDGEAPFEPIMARQPDAATRPDDDRGRRMTGR